MDLTSTEVQMRKDITAVYGQLNTALELGILTKVIQGLVLSTAVCMHWGSQSISLADKGEMLYLSETYNKCLHRTRESLSTVSSYPCTHVSVHQNQKKTVKWNLTMYPGHMMLLHQSLSAEIAGTGHRCQPSKRRKSHVKLSTSGAA